MARTESNAGSTRRAIRSPIEPQFAARNIHYEVSAKAGGITCGGIGAIHLLARRIGLIDAIDRRLHLLKIHLPYHESDHVLNIAYNALCDGTCLQDIELRRNDENFLDCPRRPSHPRPDHGRRLLPPLHGRPTSTRCIDVLNDTRRRVWAEQPDDFFDLRHHRHGRHPGRDHRPSASRAWTSPTTASGAIIR